MRVLWGLYRVFVAFMDLLHFWKVQGERFYLGTSIATFFQGICWNSPCNFSFQQEIRDMFIFPFQWPLHMCGWARTLALVRMWWFLLFWSIFFAFYCLLVYLNSIEILASFHILTCYFLLKFLSTKRKFI